MTDPFKHKPESADNSPSLAVTLGGLAGIFLIGLIIWYLTGRGTTLALIVLIASVLWIVARGRTTSSRLRRILVAGMAAIVLLALGGFFYLMAVGQGMAY